MEGESGPTSVLPEQSSLKNELEMKDLGASKKGKRVSFDPNFQEKFFENEQDQGRSDGQNSLIFDYKDEDELIDLSGSSKNNSNNNNDSTSSNTNNNNPYNKFGSSFSTSSSSTFPSLPTTTRQRNSSSDEKEENNLETVKQQAEEDEQRKKDNDSVVVLQEKTPAPQQPPDHFRTNSFWEWLAYVGERNSYTWIYLLVLGITGGVVGAYFEQTVKYLLLCKILDQERRVVGRGKKKGKKEEEMNRGP